MNFRFVPCKPAAKLGMLNGMETLAFSMETMYTIPN